MAATSQLERLLARVLRDVLRRTTGTAADVRDAFRRQCDALRIRYDQASLDRAIDLVSSNTRVGRVETPRRATREPAAAASRQPSPSEAADILHALGLRIESGRVSR
jgi:hypothetical protein